jgi:hypothetical protein
MIYRPMMPNTCVAIPPTTIDYPFDLACTLAETIHSHILTCASEKHAYHSTSVAILVYDNHLYGGGYFLSGNPPWNIPAIKVALGILSSLRMLTKHIPLIFWFDPIGKKRLIDFIIADLETLRPFINEETVFIDLLTKETIMAKYIYTPQHAIFSPITQNFSFFQRGYYDDTAPVIGPLRGKLEDHFRQVAAPDHKLLDTLLPYLRQAIMFSHSNGKDRPIRKAHSAALIIEAQEEFDVIISKNFRHPNTAYLASCAESLGLATARSEGILHPNHNALRQIIVYSTDYLINNSDSAIKESLQYCPAVCGTCKAVIGENVPPDTEQILITTLSETCRHNYYVYRSPYSTLEKRML